MASKSRTLLRIPVRDAVVCYGLRFAGPALTDLIARTGSTRPELEVHLNPKDLREVLVRDPCTGWTARVRNVDQIYAAMVDLDRHFEVCRRARFRALAAELASCGQHKERGGRGAL